MPDLSRLSQNLKTFRKEILRMTQEKFAEELSVSTSMIGNIESGVTEFPKLWNDKIKKVFNYDINKQMFIQEKEYTTITSNIIPVPFYNVKAAANPTGEMLPDYTESQALYFDKRWLMNVLGVKPYNISLIEAKGDSMQPDIMDGDLLLVDNSDIEIVNNKIYVIEITSDSTLLVKKVKKDFTGNVTLISINDKYPPRVLTEADNALIRGRVVWNSSKSTL